VLCSLLWVTLLWQGVGLGDPQRSLPTPTILWFCDSVGDGGTKVGVGSWGALRGRARQAQSAGSPAWEAGAVPSVL